MPRGLKRYYGAGDLHFVTWSCYQRRPLLDTERARDLLLNVLERMRERYRFAVLGYVIMPRPGCPGFARSLDANLGLEILPTTLEGCRSLFLQSSQIHVSALIPDLQCAVSGQIADEREGLAFDRAGCGHS